MYQSSISSRVHRRNNIVAKITPQIRAALSTSSCGHRTTQRKIEMESKEQRGGGRRGWEEGVGGGGGGGEGGRVVGRGRGGLV